MPPSTKKKSKSKKSKTSRAASEMVVPGFTRSAGAYMRYQPSGAELKWRDDDFGIVNMPVGYAAVIDPIANIAQGTEPFQRIGRQVVIRKIDVKIQLQAQWVFSAAQPFPAACSYRVDLVLDKQANGALPVPADIYDSAIVGQAATNRWLNLYNSDRFVVLKRWEGDLNPPSFGTNGGAAFANVYTQRDLKLSKNCAVKMEFSGVTGANAEIRSNNLLMVYSYESNQPANCQFNVITADTRLRFSDT